MQILPITQKLLIFAQILSIFYSIYYCLIVFMFDFAAISTLPILLLLASIGLICLIFKKKWIGLFVLLCSFAFNYYTESIPLNPLNLISFETKGKEFKILTYNMYSASDYYRSVKDNPRDFSAFLLEQDADVIVLEEYYPDLCLALRDSLLKTYPYMEYQKQHCSNAVFSKYPLTNWKEMEIRLDEDAADLHKFTRAKNLDDLRQMARFRYNASVTVNLPNDSIRLITCHMASNHYDQVREVQGDSVPLKERVKTYMKCVAAGNLEREVEAKYIMEEVMEYRAKGVKTIVLGDMNAVPGSPPIRTMRSGDLLRNGWWEKGFGPGLTFHSHHVMHFRLDHVLHTRDIILKKIGVANVDYSDHKPVIAEFVIPVPAES